MDTGAPTAGRRRAAPPPAAGPTAAAGPPAPPLPVSDTSIVRVIS